MPYRIEHDDDENCSTIVVTGDVTVDDYKSLFLDAWSRASYVGAQRALWDFSQCRTRFDVRAAEPGFATLSPDEKKRALARMAMETVQELAAFTRERRPRRLPPRIAVIAANEIDFGTVRVYAGFTGLEFPDLRVFRSLDDARRWLFE